MIKGSREHFDPSRYSRRWHGLLATLHAGGASNGVAGRLWRLCRSWLPSRRRKTPAPVASPPAVEVLPVAPVPIAVPAPPPAEDAPEPGTVAPFADKTPKAAGCYLTLGSVLDDIEHTFRVLRKLREADASAYAFNAKVGARILPKDPAAYWAADVWRKFLAELPMQGMIYSFDMVYDDDYRAPAKGFHSAQYFQKMKNPRAVLALPTDVIYKFVAVVTIPNKKRKNRSRLYGYDCHVAIRDGKAVLLREAQVEMRKVQTRDKNPDPLYVPTPCHDHPKSVCGWVKAVNREHRTSPGFTPWAVEELVAVEFQQAVNAWTASRDGEFNVRVERGGLAAAFSVPRNVEFFKDRRTGIARDGRRKRIFHSVVEHQRTLADGRTITVPSHYRGERHFSWNGYDVAITALGRMHMDVLGCDVAGVYEDDIEDDDRDMMTADEAGKLMASASERVLAGYQRRPASEPRP